MHSKRSWIRMCTRVLYASGFILLVAGLLLSAISSPALAAGSLNIFSPPNQEGTVVPDCGCTPSPGAPGPTSTALPGGVSSLVFSAGCTCSCQAASATVCNVGSGNMTSPVKWLLYYSADGNPLVNGTQVTGGTLGPLNAGQCVNLDYKPPAAGNYAYYVEQESGAAGPAYLWSSSCLVAGACFPATATSTPFSPATNTPTSGPPTFTFTPPPIEITLSPTATETSAPPATSTATRPPLAYNLSAVCGYMGEETRLWKVANHTNAPVDYTWRADNGETGSGSVGATADDYFTTSLSAQQVELYVGSDRVDTQQAVEACKRLLEVAYNCTATGLEWVVRNSNDFGVDFTWRLDTGETGRGTLGAGMTAVVATSSKGAHRLDVTWSDTRPGSHTVSLASPADSCASTVTNTPTSPPPTYTFTPPPVVVTVTNTVPPPSTLTNTPVVPPTYTFTPPPVVVTVTNTVPPPSTLTNTPVVPPTATFTPLPPTPTVTPTNTAPGYPPPVIITLTATNTNTAVPPATNTNTPVPPATNTNTPVPPATNTNTPIPPPTNTNTPVPPPTNTATTAPPVIITVIVTATPVPPTRTFTPTNTWTPLANFVTVTPGPTSTNTPVPPPTNTATTAPPVVITVIITNTPAPTATNTTVPTFTRTAAPGVVPGTGGYPAPATATPGPTNTATSLVTLAPPVAQATQTPILIPVTGVDLTRPVGANGLSILGGLLTNLGLFTLGLALALTGYTRFGKH